MRNIKRFGVITLIAVMVCTFVGCPKPTDTEPPIIPVNGVTIEGLEANEELTLLVGESIKLTAIVSPDDATDKTVRWSSIDERVATVDEYGNVTALGKGFTQIFVETNDGEYWTFCNIKVNLPYVAVTGVSLNKTDVRLKINATVQLEATITPKKATNKNITWTSSDESIASVDENGKVTAIAKGQVTIAVITEDGEKSATCKVEVLELMVGQTYYYVKYYYENIADDRYTENRDEEKEEIGAIGELTSYVADDVPGFQSPVITQKVPSIDASDDDTVIVKYARKIIELTLDLDGGTGTKSISGKYGANVKNSTEPTKAGYTFGSWTPELPETYPVENETYKATWILNDDSSINYVLDGGENDSENPTGYNIESEFSFKDPKKAGYDFDGWYTDENLRTKITGISKGTNKGEITIWAKWSPRTDTKYTVEHLQQNVDDNEYTLVESETLAGKTGSIATVTVKTFEGFKQGKCEKVGIAGDGSTVVQVKYDRKIRTLNLNGHSSDYGYRNYSYTKKYGQTFEIPSNPKRKGYTFIGWYEDEDFSGEPVTEDSPDAFEITLWAKWIPNSLNISVTIPAQTDVPKIEYSIAEEKITLTAEAGHSSYIWFVNAQEKQSGDSNTLELDAAELAAGLYSVMVGIDDTYSSTVLVAVER